MLSYLCHRDRLKTKKSEEKNLIYIYTTCDKKIPVTKDCFRARRRRRLDQVGDWTQELFRLSLEDPSMPLWITAAQPSVLEKTIYFDNGERLFGGSLTLYTELNCNDDSVLSEIKQCSECAACLPSGVS